MYNNYMNSEITTRCCIVGGGPAGMMLGYLLARAGVDVIVLEKHSDFFRDFRGDTIHPSTMEILNELGLLKEFLKLPHNETEKVGLKIEDEELTIADFTKLNTVSPFMGFMPQWDFLNFLATNAKEYKNFKLMMDSEAYDLIEDGERITGVEIKNKDKKVRINADLVIGADGRESILREKSKLKVKNLGVPIDVLWFRLSKKDDNKEKSLGYINGGKMFVLLDRDTYWQCAYIIKKGDFDHIKKEGLDKFRNDISGSNSILAPHVHELKSWDQVKLLTVEVDYLKKWHRDGLLFIGDAAHAMSPVAGVGINLAIQDAVGAANVLIPAFGRGEVSVSDLEKIQGRRYRPARIVQRLQVIIHKKVLMRILNEKNIIKPPLPLRILSRYSVLQKLPARIIGLGFRMEHIDKELFPSKS